MSSIQLLSGDGTGVDHAAFQPGSIKRIELTNFMTHAQVVLQPSSAVNFVLGANGSGKSSLVCALCLGLGGDVRDMERGSKLEDYIMKGKTFAIIKTTLAGQTSDDGDIEVVRTLRNPGQNTWEIKGEPQSMEQALRFLREDMHIQMDNKCMFLPQERVGAFSSLPPSDLLALVLRSVNSKSSSAFGAAGSKHNYQVLYEKILRTERELGETDKAAVLASKELENSELDYKNVKEIETRVVEHRELMTRIKLLTLRKAYAEAQEASAAVKEKRVALESFDERLTELTEATIEPKRAAERAAALVDDAQLRRGAAEEAFRNVKGLVANALANVGRAQERLAVAEATVEQAKASRSELEAAVESAEGALAKAKAAAEDETVKVGTSAALAASERELKREVDAAQTKAKAAGERYSTALAGVSAAEDEIAQLTAAAAQSVNVRDRRLDALARCGSQGFVRHVRAAASGIALAVRDGLFQQRVFGPLLAEVQLRQQLPSHVEAVESLIAPANKVMFVVSTNADAQVLVDLDRQQRVPHNSIVSVMNANPRAAIAAARDRPLSPAQLDAWSMMLTGSAGRLVYPDSLVEAPVEVMAVLLEDAHFATTVYAFDPGALLRLQRHVEDLSRGGAPAAAARARAEKFGVGDWPMSLSFHTSRQAARFVRGTHSTYTTVRSIGEPRSVQCLQYRLDDGAAERASQAHEAALATLKNAKQLVDDALQDRTACEVILKRARAEQGKLVVAKSALERALVRVQRCEKDLAERKQALTSDASAKEQNIKNLVALRRLQEEFLLNAAKAADLGRALAPAASAFAATQLDESHALSISRSAAEAYEASTAEVKKHEQSKARLEKDLTEKRLAATKAEIAYKTAAAAQASLVAMSAFADLPSTTADVEEALQIAEGQRAGMAVDNVDVLRVENATERLRKAQERYAVLNKSVTAMNENLRHDREKFTLFMDDIVLRVNHCFSRGLASIRVRGKVDFVVGDLVSSPATGIYVKVAFRPGEEPQTLNAEVQSGGERALTTMMFLIALAPVSTAAFRLVDEINQGMDAANEKAVMTQLLKVLQGSDGAGSAGSAVPEISRSQLFIVSPKLLVDMVHSPLIRTEIVFNGAKVGPACKSGRLDDSPAHHVATRFLDFATYARVPLPKPVKGKAASAAMLPETVVTTGLSMASEGKDGEADRSLLTKRLPSSRAAASADNEEENAAETANTSQRVGRARLS